MYYWDIKILLYTSGIMLCAIYERFILDALKRLVYLFSNICFPISDCIATHERSPPPSPPPLAPPGLWKVRSATPTDSLHAVGDQTTVVTQ